MELLEQAKQLIRDYLRNEFQIDEEPKDISKVELAYTTTYNEGLPIKVSANLIDFKATIEVNGKVVHIDSFSSLQEMIDDYLSCLDFDELIGEWSDYDGIHQN